MNKIGIIGNPLSHSLSPVMHNAAIKYLGLDLSFEKWEIDLPYLSKFFSNIKENKIIGGCITIPFKERALEYCKDVDDDAKRIGAINWFKIESGRLKGFNTDHIGFFKSLPKELQTNLSEIKVVLLGAGGSSKAIVEGLVRNGCINLSIINRTIENAVNISTKYPNLKINTKILESAEADNYISNADLIINSTSLGMSSGPDPKNSIVRDMNLKKGVVGYDLVYSPLKTPFISKIENAGGKSVTGISMLIYQAISGLKIITGKDCPYEIMENSIDTQL